MSSHSPLEQQLHTLEKAGLVHLANLLPEVEYVFRHALVQDTVYSTLLRRDKRQLHQAVGETLERLYPTQRHELASVLGHHCFEAGDYTRAQTYFRMAAEHALAIYANQEAESHFRTALSLLEQFTSTPQERAELLAGMGEALRRQGRSTEAIQTLLDAIKLFQSLGNAAQGDYAEPMGRLYALAARTAFFGGDTPRMLTLCQDGLQALAGRKPTRGFALLLAVTGSAYHFNAHPEPARRYCEQALALAREYDDVAVQADVLATMGLLANLSVAETLDALRKATQLAETAGLLLTGVRANFNLAANLSLKLGRFREGSAHFLRAAQIAQQMGDASNQLFALGGEVNARLWLGEYPIVTDTLHTMYQLLRMAARPGPGAHLMRIAEARVLRYRGEWEAALAKLREMQSISRQQGDAQWRCLANTFVGDILLELGRGLEAQDDLQEAIEIGERGLGFGWGTVWARCILSAAYAQVGRIENARHLLHEAQRKAGHEPGAWDKERLALAEAYLASSEHQWSDAFAAYARMATLADETGARWYRARTLRQWAGARLAHAPAEYHEARAQLNASLALFEELDAPHYAAQVKQQLQII
jgi:tetratricopeptide (TPR) repeat protein